MKIIKFKEKRNFSYKRKILVRDLILKNIRPAKLSIKEEEESGDKASSAIDSIGLKPKPAL